MQSSNFNASFLQSLINPDHINKIVTQLQNVNTRVEQEFLVTVSEQQINDALSQFVTKNVKAILEMKAVCHDGWFRMSCIVAIKGIYIHMASNFELVHVQLDRHRQRLVFAQKSETEILELHANSYLTKVALLAGISAFKKIDKQDLLLEVFERIKLAQIKDNVIYLDIGRWLRNNEKMMSSIQKVQVNYAHVASEQLVLKTNLNPKDIFQSNRTTDIITEKDKPKTNST